MTLFRDVNLGPGVAYRRTLEDDEDQADEPPTHRGDHGSIKSEAEARCCHFGGEDASVEKKNGNLDRGKDCDVDHLENPHPLFSGCQGL